MKIAIVKYNAGNVQSVLYALKRLGFEAEVTDDETTLRNADRVIFPGVGHAGAAMQSLKKKQLDQIIPSLTQPVLGICVGMQLMCSYSEEGNTSCLGIIPVSVKKFSHGPNLKVPQMGWNNIKEIKGPLMTEITNGAFVYFVHSYYAEKDSHTIATAEYGISYAAAIQKNNFLGVQFHTEKSADAGDQILKNFITIGSCK